MNVLNSPDVSVVEPQSVPSRISVVLVEEAKSGGAHRMECSRVDQDLRLLAGMAKPASVTVCEDSHLSPSAKETLPSLDLPEKLFSVVPAGIPLPAGQVGPVGTCGRTSPSDLTSLGLVGPNPGPVNPCGRTSPSDLTSLGLVGPNPGPVGPYGRTSPSDLTSLGLVGPNPGPVGPCGRTSPSELTFYGLVSPNPGPVGPCGRTSPSDLTARGSVGPITDSVGPVGQYVIRGPVGSYGMLSPCNSNSYPD